MIVELLRYAAGIKDYYFIQKDEQGQTLSDPRKTKQSTFCRPSLSCRRKNRAIMQKVRYCKQVDRSSLFKGKKRKSSFFALSR